MTRTEMVAKLRAMHRSTGHSELAAIADALEQEARERHEMPPVGQSRKCLVCAFERPWGIFSETTGETVCTQCRDRDRIDWQTLERMRDEMELRFPDGRDAKVGAHTTFDDLARWADALTKVIGDWK